MVMSGNVDVFESSLSLLVLQVGVTILADIVKIEVFPVDFVTVVSGSVVDYYNEVVTVILLEDGVQVVLYPKLGVVVVARDYYTHRQFVGVVSEIPNFVDSLPFFLLNPNLLFVSTCVYFVIETSQIKSLKVLFSCGEGDPLLMEFFSSLSTLLIVENHVNSEYYQKYVWPSLFFERKSIFASILAALFTPSGCLRFSDTFYNSAVMYKCFALLVAAGCLAEGLCCCP